MTSRGGGRGEYYRNKYGGGRGGKGGGGGRGRGGRGGSCNNNHHQGRSSNQATAGGSYADLIQMLHRLDGRPYPAYHDIETSDKGWTHSSGFCLYIGRAQADPFAPPTRCRVVVPMAQQDTKILHSLTSDATGRMATADFYLRRLSRACQLSGADQALQREHGNTTWKGPKGGDVQIMEPTQHVLEQSAVNWLSPQSALVVQLTIHLPARGRSILGQAACDVLEQTLPQLLHEMVGTSEAVLQDLKEHVSLVRDQVWLQEQLVRHNLVAFVYNGARLPRQSGDSDGPLQSTCSTTVIPFQSPPSLERSFVLPSSGRTISGMAIPTGVTLICGGGYHGKSTLLQTLQLGVYPKIAGDGREYCMTVDTAVKVRAEDGRSIASVDISAFLKNLPLQKDTTNFSTTDASGSTSQASCIVEVGVFLSFSVYVNWMGLLLTLVFRPSLAYVHSPFK